MLIEKFKNRIKRVRNILDKIDKATDNDLSLVRKVAKSAIIKGLSGLEKPEIKTIIKAIIFMLLSQTGVNPVIATAISARISELSQKCIDEVQDELQSSSN